MEGFGRSAGTNTMFYGSVHDELAAPSNLEAKLKKRYWETKQTLIQKLGKDQDEFVIAGDAEIDYRLEHSRRLEASCRGLAHCLKRYQADLANVVDKHYDLGAYLTFKGEKEVTSVAQIMKDVGKIEKDTSSSWYKMNPSLNHLYHDLEVFITRGLKDLNESLKKLEKARTEYRAALLWLKKESKKLQNPDVTDQLSHYRKAQAQVKEAKEKFDNLKIDVAEKIEMAIVSRCNMLSKSLPSYQNGLLKFFEESSEEVKKILLEIKKNHHPQYRLSQEVAEEHMIMRDHVQDMRDVDVNAENNQQSSDRGDESNLLLDLVEPSSDSVDHQNNDANQNQAISTKSEHLAPNNQEVKKPKSPSPLILFEEGAVSGPSEETQNGVKDVIGEDTNQEDNLTAYQEVDSLEGLKQLLKMDSLTLEEPEQMEPDEFKEDQNVVASTSDKWNELSAFLTTSKSLETDTTSSDWQKELESLMGGPTGQQQDDDFPPDLLGDVFSPSSLPLSVEMGDILIPEMTGIAAPLVTTSTVTPEPNVLPSLPIATGMSVMQPNTGMMQSNTSVMQPNTGVMQSNTGVMQPNTGVIQPNTGVMQSNTGVMQPMGAQANMAMKMPVHPTPGMMQPNAGVMQPSPSMKQPTQPNPATASNAKPKNNTAYEAWMNVFAQLDPLTNDKV